MRSLAVPVILIGIFGLSVSPLARDASLGKRTPEEVKSVCDKVGGKFSQELRRDIIVEPIVVGAPAPIATSAAKLLSHAPPK